MASPTPLRRELLTAFALLLGGALVVAAVGLLAVTPLLRSTGEGMAFVLVLLAADLVVLFAFLGLTLRTRLVAPLESLVGDVRRIAGGDIRHRVELSGAEELRAIQDSVNEMADRLIRDQELLRENVESLDRTNQELIEARDEVVQAARLASVGTLAAGIAHEVGNPLGAIIGYVDVARKRFLNAGVDPELVDSIREEAVRIDRIVRGLLDYARPKDSGSAATQPAPVLARCRSLLESQGQLDRIHHEWDLDGEDVPRITVEPHQLEQVIINILLNALQAMTGRPDAELKVSLLSEPGGLTRLPQRRVGDPEGVNYLHRRRVATDEQGRRLDLLYTSERIAVIRIEDNGPGIPEDDLRRIFDPFFTTKQPGQGTGLGLSICARLIEGMGGQIEAANAGPKGGAVFTIRLPGAESDPTEEEMTPQGETE